MILPVTRLPILYAFYIRKSQAMVWISLQTNHEDFIKDTIVRISNFFILTPQSVVTMSHLNFLLLF